MMLDKRLINLVPKAKSYVGLTVFLKIISLLSNVVFIFSLAAVLVKCKEGSLSLSLISKPLIILSVSIIASFLASFFSSVASFKSSENVKITLRSQIYRKLLGLGNSYLEQSETAKVLQLAVEGVEQIEVWFGQYLPQFFYSMIASVITFGIISFLDWKMALILLVCVPLIPMSIVAVQKIAKKILGGYMDQYANLADNYLENLQGLTTLEIYGADEDRQKKLGKEAEKFRRVTMKVLSFQLNSIIVMDLIAYGGAALGITFALSSFYLGNLSLENAVICILLSADFFIPLRRLGSYFHTAMNGASASQKIFELLDCPEKNRGNEKIVTDVQENLISFNNVNYSFGERKVLQDVSFSIDKGQMVVFSGVSGSGKSTTAKIIAGINFDYEGSATIGGVEIKNIAPDELYSVCSYISHKDWIFAGTVRDCLLEGNPLATDEMMWKVLNQVQLDEFIKSENGLDTKINENASNFSGGQKQRLSIARSLIHKSKIMIFDEATSNIDVESEKAIFELLNNLKGQKTIILISHRTENSIQADKYYKFENGKLVSGGSK